MDRIWQWTWDRYGASYTWALWVIAFFVSLPVYLTFISFPIVAFERSDRYLEAAAATVVAVALLACIMLLPERRWARLVERWAAGDDVDPASALEASYIWARRSSSRAVWSTGVWAAALAIVIAAITGATWSRQIQYVVLGAVVGVAAQVLAYHSIVDANQRPVRIAIAGDTGVGD
jgi:hypothetical protein